MAVEELDPDDAHSRGTSRPSLHGRRLARKPTMPAMHYDSRDGFPAVVARLKTLCRCGGRIDPVARV